MAIGYKIDDSETDKYIVFSVFDFLEDSDTNAESTNNVQSYLESQEIPFRKVYGKYRGEFEYSFVVNQDYLQQICKIALKYHQNCLLLIDEPLKKLRKVHVLNMMNLYTQEIGYLKSVDKEYALSNDSYIYDYELDSYFITVKECA